MQLLRRQDPWVRADRMPASVVAGNRTPSWVPPGAHRVEEIALDGLATSSVALVDDDHLHGLSLLGALRSAGHEVLHASGPRACERLIRDSPDRVTALVCRAEMDEMSGFELARRVIQRRADIRILLIFGDASDERERSRASSIGYAHAAESTHPDEICFQLARLLGHPDPRALSAL